MAICDHLNIWKLTIKRKKKKIPPTSYQQRNYRQLVDTRGLFQCEVQVQETDLQIMASVDVAAAARDLVIYYRNQLENYISGNTEFLTSLAPIPPDQLAPPIVKEMIKAGQDAGVGPMAAVAGAMSAFVGQDLLAQGVNEIVVENGGDIFMSRKDTCIVSIFAGTSPLSNKIGIKLQAQQMPLGICTSSATIGHSLSLGKADSVTVLAKSTPLADATATRLGNEVKDVTTIDTALKIAATIPGVSGALIILADKLGAIGTVELVEI